MTIPTKSAVALVQAARGLLLGTVLLAGCSKPNTFIGQWWADGTENGVPFHADMHIRGNGEVTRRVELGQLTSSTVLGFEGTWKSLSTNVLQWDGESVRNGQKITTGENEIHPETINIISVSDAEMVTRQPASGLNFKITWKRWARE